MEPEKTVILTLTNPTNRAGLGDPAQAVLTIVNNDLFGATSYTTASQPRGAASGDFNDDGIIDLAVAQYNGEVAVYLGSGGTYREPARYQAQFMYNDYLNEIQAGDFNGDGIADLIALTGSSYYRILPGNGDGTFLIGGEAAKLNGDVHRIFATDFNGDGRSDLAFARNSDGKLAVMLRDNDGTAFLPEVAYAAGSGSRYGLQYNHMRIVAGKFDSDGLTDLVVSNNVSGNIYLLAGKADETFTEAVPSGAGGSPIALAAGDFNGDGALDLAVADQGAWPNPDFLNVLMGSGDGSFQPARKISLKYGGNLTALTSADVNGDGVDDLVIGGTFSRFAGGHEYRGNFHVMPGSASGIFQGEDGGQIDPLQDNYLNLEYQPGQLTTGDLNGDGSPDVIAVPDYDQFKYNFNLLSNALLREIPLRFSAKSYTAVEDDGTATVAVTRSLGLDTGVSVDYRVEAGTAAEGTDYTAQNGTLVFAPGESGKTITVTIIDDAEMETPETVNLSLANPTGKGTLAAGWSRAVLTIRDDEPRFVAPFYEAVEGEGSATITVIRDGKAAGPVTFAYTTSDGTAQAGKDFIAAGGTLTMGAGVKETTFNVVILDDAAAEVRETVNLFLQPSGDGPLPVYRPGAVLNIYDNDLSMKKKTYDGGNWSDLEGMAGGDFNGDGLVDLAVINGNQVQILTAQGGGSFSAGSAYTVGTDPKHIVAADLNGDGLLDLATANNGSGNVSILWGMGNGSFQEAVNINVGASPSHLAVGDFNGDKKPDLAVARNDYTISPDYGRYISILTNKGSSFNLTKFYTGFRNEKIAAGDFNGDGKTDLLISMNNSTYVYVFLGNGNGTFQDSNFAKSYYAGDFVENLVAADFTGDNATDFALLKKNGNGVPTGLAFFRGGTFQKTVYNAVAGNRLVAADLNRDGKKDLAVVNNDGGVSVLLGKGDGSFFSAQGSLDTAGGNPKDIVPGDYDGNGWQDLAVLSAGTGEVSVLFSGASGILDFSAAVYSVNEGDGQAVITINRSGGTDGPVSVNYQVGAAGDTATFGEDYTRDFAGESGTITFADGAASASFEVPIIDDSLLETGETISLVLDNPTGGVMLGQQSTAVLTIVDNEKAGQLAFSQAGYSFEENSGLVTVTVSRTGGSNGDVTVDYVVGAAGDTAAAGDDYTRDYAGEIGTLAFAKGSISATFDVDIKDNLAADGDRSITLKLVNPSPPATLGVPDTAVLTILDDDRHGIFLFDHAGYTANEAGQATVTVKRLGLTTGTGTVAYATVPGGSATAGQDYQSKTGILTFDPGETSKTFTVAILDDNDVEQDETVNLALSNPQNGVLGSQNTAVLVITDLPRVNLERTAYSVPEGGTLSVKVKRGGGGERMDAGTVDYAFQDLTAKGGADYAANDGTIQFAAAETEKIISIPILNDQLDDDLEQFRLTLQNPTGAAVLGSQAAALVTINDDDGPGRLQFSQEEYTVNEAAGSVTVTVTRTEGLDGQVTVNYTIGTKPEEDTRTEANWGSASNPETTPGSDYLGVFGTLIFEPGVGVKTFNVKIKQDNRYEGEEVFYLKLASPGGGAVLGARNTAVVTIKDDLVGFKQGSYSSSGDWDQLLTFPVTLVRKGGSEGKVSVKIKYGRQVQQVDFLPGETEKTVKLFAPDGSPGNTWNTYMVLDNDGTGAELDPLADDALLSLTFQPSQGHIGFRNTSYQVNEADGLANLYVARKVPHYDQNDGGGSNTVTVKYTVARISARAGKDYQEVSGILTFPSNESKNIIQVLPITIPILADQITDMDETLTVTLSDPTGGALLDPHLATAKLKIIDNNPGTPFGHSPERQHVYKPVVFDSSQVALPPGDYQYNWDFGDGSTGSGMTATHTYATANTYLASLDILDAAGNQAGRFTQVVLVVEDLPVEEWNLDVTPGELTRARPGETVSWIVSLENNGVPVAGQAFSIYEDSGTQPVATITTDNTGKAAFTKTLPTDTGPDNIGMHKLTFSYLMLAQITGYLVYVDNARLSGTILDQATGKPLKGVQVALMKGNPGTQPVIAFTDENGAYSFGTILADGQAASITTSVTGYNSQSIGISLSALNVTRNFQLSRKSDLKIPEILAVDITREWYSKGDWENYLDAKRQDPYTEVNPLRREPVSHHDQGQSGQPGFVFQSKTNYVENNPEDIFSPEAILFNGLYLKVGTKWNGLGKGKIQVRIYSRDGILRQIVDETGIVPPTGDGQSANWDFEYSSDYQRLIYKDGQHWNLFYSIDAAERNEYASSNFYLKEPLLVGDKVKIVAVDASGNILSNELDALEITEDPPFSPGDGEIPGPPSMATAPPPDNIPFLSKIPFAYGGDNWNTKVVYDDKTGYLSIYVGARSMNPGLSVKQEFEKAKAVFSNISSLPALPGGKSYWQGSLAVNCALNGTAKNTPFRGASSLLAWWARRAIRTITCCPWCLSRSTLTAASAWKSTPN